MTEINQDNFREINLAALFKSVWQRKIFVMSVTFVFALAGVFYALSLSNVYTSQAILAPASDDAQSALPKLGGMGGLASLAGINLSGGNSNRSTIALELIKTWGFLEKIAIKHDIIPQIYAAKSWSETTNEIIYDADIYDSKQKKWLIPDENTPQELRAPTSWEVYEVFESLFNVATNEETGFITIKVDHYSPAFAKRLLEILVNEINEEIRNRDIKNLSQRISYLKQQIKETNITEMQSIFYELVRDQTQSLMLAEVSTEYALETISSARVAEEKSKPSRAIIVIVITFLGFMLSVAYTLVSQISKK